MSIQQAEKILQVLAEILGDRYNADVTVTVTGRKEEAA